MASADQLTTQLGSGPTNSSLTSIDREGGYSSTFFFFYIQKSCEGITA